MILYNRNKLEKYKLKFDGLEMIDQNYSQSYQDMFVLSMLNGKKNGTFLEIGAFDPKFISNTFLLEDKFNWNGISVDIEQSVKNKFNSRKSNFILGDATKLDYSKIFEENNMPTQIDYLQVDVEPLTQTFECLKKLPLNDYRFSVITYETDYYDVNTPIEIREKIRKESREYLESYGYELVVGDVESNVGFPYEDWYVDPNVVDSNLISKLKVEHNSLLPDNFMTNE